jgi:DNA polymerase IV
VLEETDIQVSMGGGTNRLVAKLAVSRAKPAGVFVVGDGDEAAFLAEHEIGDIPGVGPVLTAELLRYGLKTVPDGLAVPEPQLLALLGDRRGRWLYRRLRGIDDTSSRRDTPRARSRAMRRSRGTCTRTPTWSVSCAGSSAASPPTCATTGCARVRSRYVCATRTSARGRRRARCRTGSRRTARSTASPGRCCSGCARERRTGARLVGVAASNLVERDAPQAALFEGDEAGTGSAMLETERDRRLAQAADALRARFGRDAIAPADLLEPTSRQGKETGPAGNDVPTRPGTWPRERPD